MKLRSAIPGGLATLALLSACTVGVELPSASAAEAPAVSQPPSTSATATELVPTPAVSPVTGGGVIPDEPTGPELDGDPVSDEYDDGTYRLVLTAGQDQYRAGQLIDVTASVTYLGPAETWSVRGPESGLVGFGIESDTLPILIGPAFTTACSRYEFTRGVPVDFAFSKLNAHGEPNTLNDFYSEYTSSDELRLPAGTWTITAGAEIGTCGGEYHGLQASVTVRVEP
jgi:hypothetical protein